MTDSPSERSDKTTAKPSATEIETVRERARKADQLGRQSPRGSLVRTSYFDLAAKLYLEAHEMELSLNAG